jgi:hypothetical protein
MSDQDTSKGKARAVNAWSEHEVVSTLGPLQLWHITNTKKLVYVLSAIEHTGVKIDFAVRYESVALHTTRC